MANELGHLNQPVTAVAHMDFTTLRQDLTVEQAFEAIRRQDFGDRIVYFYVVDRQDRLTGVLPARRMLTAQLDQKLSDVMIKRIVTIPQTATVMDACEMFVIHKFLAFPVVDDRHRIVGVVDVNLFTDEVFDLAEREHLEELFETIGFHISQVRGASPVQAFRFRFPWLLASITSGTICALLSSAFELTIAKSIILAFFLTMMLGLGESVTIQSMTVTIQTLRSVQPTFAWYFRTFRREVGTALLLGMACGTLVGAIIWLWFGALTAALTIGLSIVLALFAACFFGLSVPALLHALKLDPKIAAGPVTLALTDISTLLVYFSLAELFLNR